jgi:hypothetical protein
MNPDYSLQAWTKIRVTIKITGDPLSKWTELGVQLTINRFTQFTGQVTPVRFARAIQERSR